MYVLPQSLSALKQALTEQATDHLTVVCYCAEWCDTCTAYRPLLDALSQQHPSMIVVWVDIEENESLLGDADIENFPTLLIQRNKQNVFFGPVPPHIEHLERMLAHVSDYPVVELGPKNFEALVVAAAQ